MKRRKLITMTAGAILLLTACSTQTSETDTAGNAEENVAQTEVEPTAEPTQEPTATPTPEPTATPTPEPEPVAWFDEKGLKITPQGDFTFDTVLMSSDGRVLIDINTFEKEKIDVPSNVTITETTEGAEEGYKKVTAVFNCDYSAGAGKICYAWSSAFDRYSGVSFEVDPDTTYGNATEPGVVQIKYKGEVYDVRMEYDAQQNGNTDTYTVTVICPEDYDGTVFDIGCAYKDLSEMYDKIDLKKKLYTIDELPYYGDHYSYYYFSSSDK